jgi:hypothetical protein
MANLFAELPRPQYPSSPEVLISALAWSLFPRRKGEGGYGLIYDRDNLGEGRKIERTMPVNPDGNPVAEWVSRLAEGGIKPLVGNGEDRVAMAVARAMVGTVPKKGVGKPSSAMGIAGALLQDPVGALGVPNPPNFAKLINTIYALGATGDGPFLTASDRWLEAATRYAMEPSIKTIENAFVHASLKMHLDLDCSTWPPTDLVLTEVAKPDILPTWWEAKGFSPSATPFGWFHDSWDNLCSKSWTDQLSPRRWTSWATCVLRHALAFSFLWESNFFKEVAHGVIRKGVNLEDIARNALHPPRPLVPWQRGSISEMDVKPGIRGLLSSGLACRAQLMEMAGGMPKVANLIEAIAWLRENSTPAGVATLREAYSGKKEGAGFSNLKETVEYALLCRSSDDAGDGDYYSLLRTVSRNFAHVDPAPEWIVVMVAMSSRGPGDPVRLGDVLRTMRNLGLHPRIDNLVSELEKAGLCASAADGDEGIEINLGFGSRP